MDLQNALGAVLKQISETGTGSGQEAHSQFEQLSNLVPASLMGSTIGPALSSLGTQEVAQNLLGSAGAMNPQQRGSLFSSLLSGFSSQGIDTTSLLGQLGVNPSVANNPETASPQDVAALAAHAHENSPDVFHKAMEFYGEHPTLVKTLGTVAVGAIVGHFMNKHS